MKEAKPTLAIYAIQDRNDGNTPYYVHDHGITLMHRAKVLKHLTLERISRHKHDNKLHQTIYQILKEEHLLAPDDFDLLFPDNVVGRSFISSCGKLRFEAPLNYSLLPTIEEGRCWWLDHERKAYAINHELAHISSCLPFYGSFREDSLLIHFDGGGSLSNFSAWQYKNKTLRNLTFHWDYKYLSSFFNANALVFGIIGARFDQQNAVPGKMMGLASFGTYSKQLEVWLVENKYFADIWGKKSVFIQKAQKDFGWKKGKLSTEDSFLQDIVATLQHIFIRDLLDVLRTLQKQTQAKYLYYTGGSALNIVANKAIVESGLFEDVLIPPCPEDSGLSLGAAAFMEWQKHGRVEIHSPYLNNWKLDGVCTVEDAQIKQVAKAIYEGKVIGVCNGLAEIGPRALGNRSIMARADSSVLAKKVSMDHKGREWYRPVAPIMLEENAAYFTGIREIHHLSNLMLLDFKILDEKKKEIEGVVHIDGTARIQTIREDKQNPFMFALLTELHHHYAIRALINTSFNKRGEPIVHTPENALQSAQNMRLDGVVINGFLTMLKH
jgi:carbamoyltransferase